MTDYGRYVRGLCLLALAPALFGSGVALACQRQLALTVLGMAVVVASGVLGGISLRLLPAWLGLLLMAWYVFLAILAALVLALRLFPR